jgi:ABC-type Fe3+-siderophore transport system permease subunit
MTELDDAWLLAERQRYDALSDHYDRAVLSLAGGALALSIIFADRVAAKPAVQPHLLGWAWTSLIISMLFITFSYVPSIKQYGDRITQPIGEEKDLHNWPGWMSNLGAVALTVGLGLLARFAFVNLI